ncbi:MAG: amino acid adenylation domain-containing protein [Oscillospiraceae bacterium]|nr:amino acid adenylation domain-containing protein [Oscillospiraceae bacterium]
MKTVLELLEHTADRFPKKTAFTDETESLTYEALLREARQIGACLLPRQPRRRAVAVYLPKTVHALAACFGAAYSGGFYVVIDEQMPQERIRSIFETLSPAAVLTDEAHRAQAETLLPGGVVLLEHARTAPCDLTALDEAAREIVDTDPLYTLFTSGSTGVPKGAVVSHRSVLAYADWVTETFSITEDTVFGNQTPFYFSMSVLDIYSTIKAGATMHIIPKKLFSFPVTLLEYLNTRQVNTLYWVPSALNIVAIWKALDYVPLPLVKTILFAGEVMPVEHLNYWIAHQRGALFANLYGPTEVTDICTYYVVDRPFQTGETLPIGRACANCGILVLAEDGREAAPGEAGELLVRGSFLACGYFNNPENTAQFFIQNPCNQYYPETVYKTGDLVKFNSRGELLYLGRKDFQIKHMGYRIELGEIEAAASALPGMHENVCLYDPIRDRILLCYQAHGLDEAAVLSGLRARVPAYMLPNKLFRLPQMPHNANGKLDRALLKTQYLSQK